MDKLDTIFEMQASLNEEITTLRHLEHWTADDWQQHLTLAMLSELAEALDETDFKWWKNPKKRDPADLKGEIVDMLHFLISMAQRAGMDADELFGLYLSKNKENFDRQRGKSQKPGYAAGEGTEV
jgi:dimeric dUTPase (all-alpha-NTP-PPase superfamily)